MRRPLIAGNWKLHKTVSEATALVLGIKSLVADIDDADIVVAPVFTALTSVAQQIAGSNIDLAAQNCYCQNSGAFTGEVAPAMLKDAGCRYVIVGHSERRQIFGESNELINAKMKALLAEGLMPILCIGETLEERETGRMYDVLTSQLKEGLDGIDGAAMADVVIAYEPVWAIGTGKVASTEQAAEAHAFIRGLLQGIYEPDIAEQTRILYGGSVKPDNVDGLMAEDDIDGALVGGASLNAEDFAGIVRFARR